MPRCIGHTTLRTDNFLARGTIGKPPYYFPVMLGSCSRAAGEPHISPECFHREKCQEEEHHMAFYGKDNIPRDPSAINRPFNFESFVTGILLLALIAVAISLYLFLVVQNP
jgi:hypothetical protein